jgi:hypothetical protein
VAGSERSLYGQPHRTLHTRIPCDLSLWMKQLVPDPQLVAYCGLYCGACRSYLRERCPGCHLNVKAGWCKVRSCCAEHGYSSCAACKEHADPDECRRFNNTFAKLMGFALNSNRKACIEKIRSVGLAPYAALMAEQRRQTLPRR